MIQLVEIWQERRLQIVLVGVGVVLLAAGAVQLWWVSQGDEVKIEGTQGKRSTLGTQSFENQISLTGASGVAGAQSTAAGLVGTVVVDVNGAVNSPGVYRFDVGTRVAEAIEAAGGFAANYDLAWVGKLLNQAAQLQDGQKIYIPFQNQSDSGNQTTISTNDFQVDSGGVVAGSGVINVNVASQAELETLWGIGEARAQAIIANRPYASIEELREKAKVPQSVLERNQSALSVY